MKQSIEGQRVRSLRALSGETLREFGERFGVSHSSIQSIESGNQGLSINMAKQIAIQFDVSLDWLYGLTEEELIGGLSKIETNNNQSKHLDIKQNRLSLGLTQEALASVLGISRQTLVNYENGQVPTFAIEKLSRQLKAIANKSKLDIKEIIGNRLQELRGSTALNDISEKLNMSTSKYIALENGKSEVDVNDIIAIIDHYQISADYLFGREATSQTQNQTQSIEQSSTPSADTTSNSTDQSLLLTEKDERIKVLEQLIAQQKDVIDIYRRLANPEK